MLTLLTVFFWMGLIAGTLALLAFFLGRFFHVEPRPDAVHYLESADGWRIGLARYVPKASLPGAPPVVLCPGFGFSSTIYDLHEEVSLPRFLSTQGYDVWTLDFRGRGLSEKPRLWGRVQHSWCFDDYLDFDIPAAVERICQLTGATDVQWIGFDMGALALWAAVGEKKIGKIKSIIALGAPAFFKRQRPLLATNLLRVLSLFRLEAMATLLSPLWGRLYPPPLHLLQNEDNIDRATYRRALVNAVCSFSRKEMMQYRQWLEEDCFQSIDQQRNFRATFENLTIPTLFVCGVRDALGPLDMVDATAQAMPRLEQKETLLASRMHGMSTNYGHLDLLIGRNAHRDIYPHLLRWLDLHSGLRLEGRPVPPSAEDFPADPLEPTSMPSSSTGNRHPDLDDELLEQNWIPPTSAELLNRATSPYADEEQEGEDEEEEPSTIKIARNTHEEKMGKDADADEENDDDLDWLDGDVPHVPPRDS